MAQFANRRDLPAPPFSRSWRAYDAQEDARKAHQARQKADLLEELEAQLIEERRREVALQLMLEKKQARPRDPGEAAYLKECDATAELSGWKNIREACQQLGTRYRASEHTLVIRSRIFSSPCIEPRNQTKEQGTN